VSFPAIGIGSGNQIFILHHLHQRCSRPRSVSSLTKKKVFRCLWNWSNDIRR